MPKCVVWLPRRLFARDKSISHNKQFHNVHSVSESRQLNGILGAIRVGIQLKRGHILYQFYDTLPPVSACVRADGVERWISISSGTFSGMSSIFRVILRFFSSFRFIYANCVSACHPVRRGKSQKPTPEKKNVLQENIMSERRFEQQRQYIGSSQGRPSRERIVMRFDS